MCHSSDIDEIVERLERVVVPITTHHRYRHQPVPLKLEQWLKKGNGRKVWE